MAVSDNRTPGRQGQAAAPMGGGGAWPGFETTHRTRQQRPSPTGVEGAGGTGGPGRGAGGRRQGQGGPRDRPLRAAGSRVAISRAGRRPPAHTAARPNKVHAAPRTPAGPQATRENRSGDTAAASRENKNRRPRRICGFIVREGGVEPPLHHWNTDLNRARLPIPPLARTQKE